MRSEFAPRPTAEETNRRMLKDARDADLARAVRREQADAARKGFPLSPAEAKNQVLERIGTEGVAGILPQYARIRTRMGISDDVELNDRPRRPKVRTASQYQPEPEPAAAANNPDLDRMRATIAAAEDAGEDASDSRALLAYLEAENQQ